MKSRLAEHDYSLGQPFSVQLFCSPVIDSQRRGNMEGFVEFESSLLPTDDSMDFAADFVEDATQSAPASERRFTVGDRAADAAWLFHCAFRSSELGEIAGRRGWIDVAEQ